MFTLERAKNLCWACRQKGDTILFLTQIEEVRSLKRRFFGLQENPHQIKFR